MREAAGSLPLAVTDLTGAALAATADTVPAGHTPTLYAVRTTLVAMIVGGVSIAAAWLLAASLCAKKRGKGLVDGMDHLSNRDGTFPWRGPMLVVSLAWLFLSWVLLLWPDWHVFGTDASGQDVLGVLLKGLLPGFGAASLLGLSGFVFFRAKPFSERWPRGAAVFAPVGVAFGAASVVTASGASLFGTPQLLLAGDAVTLLFAFLFWGLAALAARRGARAGRGGSKEHVREHGRGRGRGREAEVLPGHGGRHAAAGRTLEKALLNEIGFDHVLERFAVFAHGGREIVDPDGTAREFFENRAQELRGDEGEPHGVDVEHREGGLRHFPRHASVVAHLRVVAHATKKAVRDARRAAAAGAVSS